MRLLEGTITNDTNFKIKGSSMELGPGDGRAKSARDLISEMGRERQALRAKGAAVALLRVSGFLCLVPPLAGLAGYIPYVFGPSVVMVFASILGFAVSVIESRRS